MGYTQHTQKSPLILIFQAWVWLPWKLLATHQLNICTWFEWAIMSFSKLTQKNISVSSQATASESHASNFCFFILIFGVSGLKHSWQYFSVRKIKCVPWESLLTSILFDCRALWQINLTNHSDEGFWVDMTLMGIYQSSSSYLKNTKTNLFSHTYNGGVSSPLFLHVSFRIAWFVEIHTTQCSFIVILWLFFGFETPTKVVWLCKMYVVFENFEQVVVMHNVGRQFPSFFFWHTLLILWVPTIISRFLCQNQKLVTKNFSSQNIVKSVVWDKWPWSKNPLQRIPIIELFELDGLWMVLYLIRNCQESEWVVISLLNSLRWSVTFEYH